MAKSTSIKKTSSNGSKAIAKKPIAPKAKAQAKVIAKKPIAPKVKALPKGKKEPIAAKAKESASSKAKKAKEEPKQLDLCLLMDCTSSMHSWI